MKDQFVTFEVAKKLRELGFKELTNYFYSQDGKLIPRILESGNEPVEFEPEDFYENFNTIAKYEVKGIYQTVFSAPLWQQTIDWLREEKQIYLAPDINDRGDWFVNDLRSYKDGRHTEYSDSYEEGREQAVNYAINLI